MTRLAVALALAAALAPLPADAQTDVIREARTLAEGGRRPAAISLLAGHLERQPNDVDARLVYGLVLSWEGRYDEARRELQQVLAEAPDYADARVALMNVEWWSGRVDAARELVNQVLARDAGNPQARLVQQRLDARTRPWRAGISYTRDTFTDDRVAWQETALTAGRETAAGTLLVRASRSERFSLTDEQYEVEFYPQFRAGTYAMVSLGMSPAGTLYPDHRAAFDLYQALPRGFEVSGGYRRLAFGTAADIYVASVSKYQGSWMITGRVQYVPGTGDADSWSYHASARRYFGAEGRSFWGATYIHGLTREEIRNTTDLVQLESDTFRAQVEAMITPRLNVQLSAGASRQDRAARDALWQTTLNAGLSVRF